MDPDELLVKVDDAVASSRPDLARAREDRQIEKNFLAIQGRLDGSASLYGEASPEYAATITQALDAFADAPLAPKGDGPTRAQQRMDALARMCEATLAGDLPQSTRPRPRLIATIDLEAITDGARVEGARLLWYLIGRAPRLTPLSTETLLCDTQIQPVVFAGARPVAVGDVQSTISSRLRTALIARDGACRSPGCGAPVSWCDAHHITPKLKNGPTTIDNLVLLCRRCHRRMHRHGGGSRYEKTRDGVQEPQVDVGEQPGHPLARITPHSY